MRMREMKRVTFMATTLSTTFEEMRSVSNFTLDHACTLRVIHRLPISQQPFQTFLWPWQHTAQLQLYPTHSAHAYYYYYAWEDTKTSHGTNVARVYEFDGVERSNGILDWSTGLDYWSGRGDIFKHTHNNKKFSSRQADELALH